MGVESNCSMGLFWDFAPVLFATCTSPIMHLGIVLAVQYWPIIMPIINQSFAVVPTLHSVLFYFTL